MGEGGASIYDRYMCCGRSLESIAPSAAARDAAQIEELRAVLQRLVNVTQSQHTSSAIPRLVQGELLCLATEADLLLCPKKTLLFLQGDFGSSYFVVLCGSVELYVEKRKEKEMRLAGELGHLRMKAMADPLNTLSKLGDRVTSLGTGCGFGEIAILNRARRFRGASAVVDPDSALLVVHENCYIEVLQRHHLRQQRIAQGMEMLRQASWMKGVNYATLGQLAYNMIFSSLPAKSIVVRAGDAVDLIYLVARGFVTMYPAYPSLSYPHKNREVANYAQRGRSCHTNLKLAVSMRGRGCLIGEREFRGGAVVYEHTYETAEETDLFVLPKRALEVALIQGNLLSRTSDVVRVKNYVTNQLPSKSKMSESMHGCVIDEELARVSRAVDAISSSFGRLEYKEKSEKYLSAFAHTLNSCAAQATADAASLSASAPDAAFHRKTSRYQVQGCSDQQDFSHPLSVTAGMNESARGPTSPSYPPPSRVAAEGSSRHRPSFHRSAARYVIKDDPSSPSPIATCAFRPFKLSVEHSPKLAWNGECLKSHLQISQLHENTFEQRYSTGISLEHKDDIDGTGMSHNGLLGKGEGPALLMLDKITKELTLRQA